MQFRAEVELSAPGLQQAFEEAVTTCNTLDVSNYLHGAVLKLNTGNCYVPGAWCRDIDVHDYIEVTADKDVLITNLDCVERYE